MMPNDVQSLLARVEFATPDSATPQPRRAAATPGVRSMLARVEFASPHPLPRPDAKPGAASSLARPLLFLRAWASNPLRMGSVIPSSRVLCRLVVRAAWPAPGKAVLQLGAGTGVVAHAFLQAGLAPERLVLVEIDPAMAAHLRTRFPGVTIIEGDARALPDLLPAHFQGRIGSVVCCIPLVLLAEAEQRRFIDAIAAVAPGRGFVHYSYCVTSPLPARRLGLAASRQAWTPLNLPPASVWRYSVV
jgi:phosphatidylethanolamine/phosphatidyl-N-methylethanolamine N-methyltransferase